MSDGNEKYLSFRKSLKAIFDSQSGKEVMDFLRDAYVDVPVVSETAEITYYKLGQKEFVQGLLKDATTEIAKVEDLVKGG